MLPRIERMWWVGVALLMTSCATLPTVPASPEPASQAVLSDDDDFSQLIAQLRTDLNRHNSRETPKKAPATTGTTQQAARARDKEFADRAKELFAPLSGMGLRMPVVGIQARDLDDSWHAPRDGGVRLHKGIDIFAPKGTAVVAVANGVISYIGDQPKGGHCIWLTTESGASFYYAHLDRWAPGIYEGMEVQSGDLLGFVGNTGNALRTPPHLHFAVNQNDEMVNPYPILTRATPVRQARTHVTLGGGTMGTR